MKNTWFGAKAEAKAKAKVNVMVNTSRLEASFNVCHISLSGLIRLRIATKRNIISWNETDTINHFWRLETWELIGSQFEVENWMLMTRKATNHIHAFGSGEWLIEREADRNVLQIKCIPSAFHSHTNTYTQCIHTSTCIRHTNTCCLVYIFVWFSAYYAIDL